MSARAGLVHKKRCTSVLLLHLSQNEEAMSKEPTFALL